MKYLILLLLPISLAWGEPINFIHFRGNGGVTHGEFKSTVKGALAYYSMYARGLPPIVIHKLKTLPAVDPCEKLNALSKELERYYCYKNYARKYFRRHPTLFVVPPAFDDVGHRWMTGRSHVCGGAGYVVAERENSFGQERLGHSMWALAHELGHLLGADDMESSFMLSVMNTDLLWELSMGTTFFPLDNISITHINYCQNDGGWW
jgi:hypothetical protein